MGCDRLLNDQGAVVGFICGTGRTVEEPIRKRRRWKWCFNCRARLPHMLTMTREVDPSYYEPHVWWKCDRCGEDFTLFWGYEYDR
jgi:RNase P subunit RPR2